MTINPETARRFLKQAALPAAAVLLIVFFAFSSLSPFSDSSPSSDALPGPTDPLLEGMPASPGSAERAGAPGAVPAAAVQAPVFYIDVKGAVKRPGVYTVNPGERVQDVLRLAGGLRADADAEQVNFAAKLADEQVLYIAKRGEVPPASASVSAPAIGGASGSTAGDLVELNSADEEALKALPGIGPAKAKAILTYREQVGRFANIEDLKSVSGIGDKTFDKLKDFIRVQ